MSRLFEYLLEPQDHLIFRTGKPFGSTGPGETLPMPPQPTLAGSIRSAFAEHEQLDYRDAEHQKRLRQIECRGPLLARFDVRNESLDVLFPKPADAMYVAHASDQSNPPQLHCLRPGEPEAGFLTDLDESLLLVALDNGVRGKPSSGHDFWSVHAMTEWLLWGQVNCADPLDESLGISNIPEQTRTHNAISPSTRTTEDGVLFQNTGLDFSGLNFELCPQRLRKELTPQRRLALLVNVSAAKLANLRTLGADGRLIKLSSSNGHWPVAPPELTSVLESGQDKHPLRIRLILATPGVFDNGHIPGWLQKTKGVFEGSPPGFDEIRLRLRAVANNRWQPVSGWDIQERSPKIISRTVPAGAVYWFDVLEGSASDVEKLWLQPISDKKPDRLDGYGMVLVGHWV